VTLGRVWHSVLDCGQFIKMSITDYLYSAAKYLTLLVSTGFLGIVAMLYWNQNMLIYPSAFPQGSRTNVPTPDSVGVSKWEEVYIESEDKTRLHCFLLKSPGAKHTIVYYHANAGNMGHRVPIAKEIMNRLQCNVFMLSYRGYGKSDGSANEMVTTINKGMKMDSQAALDYVLSHKDLKDTKIIVFGQVLLVNLEHRRSSSNLRHVKEPRQNRRPNCRKYVFVNPKANTLPISMVWTNLAILSPKVGI
jgi:hypothetical protein